MPQSCSQFPTSLPIVVPADACVNNKSLCVKVQSDLNLRLLIAEHTTSQIWEDFRLPCALLDLKVPTARKSKHHMSNSWIQPHVKFPGQCQFRVKMFIQLPIHTQRCRKKFKIALCPLTPLGTADAISRIKDLQLQLIQNSARSSITSCTTESAIHVQIGPRIGGKGILWTTEFLGQHIWITAPPNTPGLHNPWKVRLRLKSGSDQFLVITSSMEPI